MAKFIRTSTIAQAWLTCVKKIMQEGREVTDERGTLTKELQNVMIEITNPSDDTIPECSPWHDDRLETYKKELLDPDNSQGFVYTYGNRLREYFEVDQLEKCIEKLNNCRESRRAIAITIDPIQDNKVDEIPCLQEIAFLIRDEKLYMTDFFRSNDCGGATFPNLFGIREVGYYVAEKTNTQLVNMVHHAMSLHIYEHDWDKAREILQKY
ncbi:MAG: thymidylate synthase [Methanosphaera stadtmanae]|jgi:thymidylate synthase|nr:thymidylate synthase [Methanosphaera stadtmanae]